VTQKSLESPSGGDQRNTKREKEVAVVAMSRVLDALSYMVTDCTLAERGRVSSEYVCLP